MPTEENARTAETNGRVWGARAHDWANIQEGTCRPVYLAVFDRIGLRSDTSYLDAGCGAGMAAQVASERGARVSGLDAAEDLLTIARTRVPGGEFHSGELESLPFQDALTMTVAGSKHGQVAFLYLLPSTRIRWSRPACVVIASSIVPPSHPTPMCPRPAAAPRSMVHALP